MAREYYSEADARWVCRPLSFQLPSLSTPTSLGRLRPLGPAVLLWAEQLPRLRQTVCLAEVAFLLGVWSMSQEQALLYPPPDRRRLESGSARPAPLPWGRGGRDGPERGFFTGGEGES